MINRQHEKGLRNIYLDPFSNRPLLTTTQFAEKGTETERGAACWGTQPGSGEATNQSPKPFLSVLLH